MTIDRRAMLGATAAALAGGAAVNLAALAIAKAETVIPQGQFPDPIFALIEDHRAAYMDLMAVMTDVPSVDDDLVNEGPEYDAAADRDHDAAIALTNVQPTTIQGIIALLAHINDFNRRGLASSRRKHFYSDWMALPETLYGDDGHGMPFAFWLLENVRNSLIAIERGAVRS